MQIRVVISRLWISMDLWETWNWEIPRNAENTKKHVKYIKSEV